ncbi:MAG: ATP-binding cassette domain-containing protein [Pseudomonadota bacterium]
MAQGALAGLLPIDAGTVAATDGDGQPCEAPALSIYCGPLNAVKSAMTVRENLQFWSALYSAPRPRLEEALDAFSLRKYADRPAGALSTGLARRLGLSRLVIADRPLWLVDEPTASLDASSITAFVALAERRRRTGGVVIAATHDAMTLESAQSMELITERAHA